MIEELSKDELKANNIVVMKRKDIYNQLERIENESMKKYHTSYRYGAVYDILEDYCLIRKDDHSDFVFKKKFDHIIKRYKKNKIHSDTEYSIGLKKFDPIAKMFVEGNIPEC